MRPLRLLASLALCLATTAFTARPADAHRCHLGPPAQRAAAAMASVRYPLDTLGLTLRVAGGRRGILGGTWQGSRTIALYVRPCEPTATLAAVAAHEVGHVVDAVVMTDARRAEWLAARGISPRPWLPTGPGSDFASPAGDFAEGFAWIHGVHSALGFRSRLAPAPGPDVAGGLERFWWPAPSAPDVSSPATTIAASTTTTTAPRGLTIDLFRIGDP
ncbi:MAG TPA: hypothetical protein VFJ85_02780 [Acidimicrobiales bacterium]|nr:hypothetical protein [Acidimicrobiales bacterium]